MKANLILLSFSLVFAEFFLQALGYPTWIPKGEIPAEDSWTIPDDKLGWKNGPGTWTLADSERGVNFVYTFLNDSSRFSGNSSFVKRRISFVGDSYVQGYGLSDEDTFVSQLQQQLPNVKFSNFGVPGFGTYQSLLMIRTILLNESSLPDNLIYVLNSFHDQRNIGDLIYLRRMQFTKNDSYKIPYVTLDQRGELEDKKFVGLPYWKLSTRSSIVALIDDIYHLLISWADKSKARKVTIQLLKLMADEAERKHLHFSVILLDASASDAIDYSSNLRLSKIDFKDCTEIGGLGPEYRLPDGHPNKVMNLKIADCISQILGD